MQTELFRLKYKILAFYSIEDTFFNYTSQFLFCYGDKDSPKFEYWVYFTSYDIYVLHVVT